VGYFNILIVFLSCSRQVWMQYLAACHDHFILRSLWVRNFYNPSPIISHLTFSMVYKNNVTDIFHIRKFPGSDLRPKTTIPTEVCLLTLSIICWGSASN
jgi:predicted choloylglycine hydrolase